MQGSSYGVSGNGGVVEAVAKWALKEAGVIRVVDVKHNKVCDFPLVIVIVHHRSLYILLH